VSCSERAEAEKTRDTQVAQSRDKFHKFHVYFCTRLRELRKELDKSLGELGRGCLNYPEKGGTIGGIINWFMGEIQALPDFFTEANKNISCFAMAGSILKMLEVSGCGHVSELWPMAVSSDASVLRDILEDIKKITGRLVRRWWTNHGLPECMRHLKEDNKVSCVSIASSRGWNVPFFFMTVNIVSQVETDRLLLAMIKVAIMLVMLVMVLAITKLTTEALVDARWNDAGENHDPEVWVRAVLRL
jgi:hypothetical protein